MTAAIEHKNALGYGIYTSTDIAQLLGIPRSKVARYLKNYWDDRLGRELFNDSYTWQSENRNVKAVNFYVLIELFICFELQKTGVKPHKILEARKNIALETKTTYPFATSNVLSDGRKIWYQFKDSIIDADGSRQTNFEKIIKAYVKNIDFNKQEQAVKFYPNGRNSTIVINPHNQFGQPIIEGTNVNAEMIYSMYKSGEPIEFITHLYDLPIKSVNDAIQFYQKAA
jgi:uncharacterized protein (DUF433 family)/predicted transcriptional regulator